MYPVYKSLAGATPKPGRIGWVGFPAFRHQAYII